ncbi:MAG TPA: FHA domain-containing protein [Anaerolineaceae bacterium]
MSAIVVLILRLVLVSALLAFLGYAFYSFWHDLRLRGMLIQAQKILPIDLLPLNEPDAPPIHFSDPEIIIGRSANATLILRDETISSQHTRLTFHHNQWWIEDLNSKNGTYLNDEKVYTPTVIITDDEIRCGVTSFRVSINSKNEETKHE